MTRNAALAGFVPLFLILAAAEDWPTYQHDHYRSGVTSEQLAAPLNEVWRYTSLQPPQPAWPDPAKKDFAIMGGRVHRPRTTYDRAFHVAAVGDKIFFGSSADDRIVALDAATGAEIWSFFTAGPVRLAPTIAGDLLYAGSDDGYVYCLRAADGSLAWKYSPDPAARKIPGNGRIISACPIRSGVVVKDGVVYVGAGIFPEEGVYLCALDAATGAERWKTSPDPMDFIKRFSSQNASRDFALSPQGYLLASEQKLYIPTGRTSPVTVNPLTGEVEGLLNCPVGEGGTYALLTQDMLVSGPGSRLTAFDPATQEKAASFPGRCILVKGDTSFLLTDNTIAALDRAKFRENMARLEALREERKALREAVKKMPEAEQAVAKEKLAESQKAINNIQSNEYAWRKPCPESYTMIVAGDTLMLGTENEVIAMRTSDGEEAWRAKVEGNAYGLAAANGHLLVSTDTGAIHCFSPAQTLATPSTRSTRPTRSIFPTAEFILKTAAARKGYCLDLGCDTGALALDIAQNSELKVLAVADDDQKVAAVRAILAETGLYGTRVAAMSAPLDKLPLTDYLADVIVSDRMLADGQPPCPPSEAARLLRPCGGMMFLHYTEETAADVRAWAEQMRPLGCEVASDEAPWLIMRRGPLPGAGAWTHQYADPGNTACSGDSLVSNPARLQWFGLPGPRPMVDRHHRAMPPLVNNGRLFVPGDNCVIAADAYNGTPLWELETPNNRRLASPRDSGHMAAADDLLYVAVRDECWVLDAATGERLATYTAPQLVDGEKRNWGYIAVVGDLLFGSGQKPDAAYTTMSTIGDFEIQWGDFKRLVTSDYLFCMDRHTGKVLWTHREGIVLHPAIAAGNGRLYFIESQAGEKNSGGRSMLQAMWDNAPALVALDIQSGRQVWRKPVDFSLCQHVIYLSYANETLLVTGSGNRDDRAWYYLYAFDAPTGEPLWQADHPNNRGGVGGDHGEQVHHPVIAGDIIYAEPVAYLLRTGVRVDTSGQPADWELDRREGCGTLSASANCLFYRDGHPSMNEINPESPRTKLNHVTRAGCWINTIPAGGLILIPEASSGCSCPYPLQTSLAYIPWR